MSDNLLLLILEFGIFILGNHNICEEKKIANRTHLKTLLAISMSLLMMAATIAAGRTIYVDGDGPVDFNNIQSAIDDSNDGDTIIVADGTYTGDGNRDIDFLGKAITVRSENGPESCIIDRPGKIGFTFHNEEGADSVLEGFTISRASALEAGGAICCSGSSPTIRNCIIRDSRVRCIYYDAIGGGIYCSRSSPTIVDCIITDNWAGSIGCDGHAYGGGIYCYRSSPVIRNCTISDNSVGSEGRSAGGGIYSCNCNLIISHCKISGNGAGQGSGIYCSDSSLSVRNCEITGNEVSDDGGGICSFNSSVSIINCILSANDTDEVGGGICSYDSSVSIINCTIAGNQAGDAGGGIYAEGGDVTITNSILRDNFDDNMYDPEPNEPIVTFSNLQPGWPGNGNIDTDPCFVSPGYWDANGVWIEGDYHLLADSPCINAGDPNYIAEPNETDLDGKPRVIGGRIDMGAYESPLPAEVRIVPRTINLTSMGKWITCYIFLPEDYDVTEIDPNSVLLEDEIQAQSLWLDEEEQVAIAKFGRSEVQGILNIGWVELTITGQLTGGTVFKGTDVIRVIDKGGRKSAK